MLRRKPRKIVLESGLYLWRVHHRHAASGCSEVFSAFAARRERTNLRIVFPETTEHGSGFPRQAGVVVDYSAPSWSLNLNLPSAARLLIELALSGGWDADCGREHVIDNGYLFLRERRTSLNMFGS
ncbi:MAG: hypothetical protein HOW73_40195 [Polyangiaceae bacterium]|nr:hypothetical protein [Polyangiaceae bacterium]